MLKGSLRQAIKIFVRGQLHALGLLEDLGLDLNIPLLTSITPTIGSPTSSFSRSTTATVEDFEGVICTAKINELRFPGARRVENLILSSEDLTNTSWIKIDTTVSGNQAVSPFGDLTADYVIESSGTESIQHSIRQLMSITSGITYSYSVYAKLNSIGNKRYLNLQGRPEAFGTVIAAIFDLENGTIISDVYGAGAIESIGNGWYRCSVTANAVTTYTGSNVFWIRLSNEDTKTVTNPSYIGDGVSGLTIFGVQCEKITGTQTEPSEYISNGVLSAPYHGNGVDGVKYFSTDREGNALTDLQGTLIETAATNLITYSKDLASWSTASGGCTITAASLLTVNGLWSDKIANIDSNTDAIYKTVTLAVSTKYCMSFMIKNVDSMRSRINFWNITLAASQADLQIAWTSGVPSTFSTSGFDSISYTSMGDGWYMVELCLTTTTSGTSYPITFYPEYATSTVHSVYLTRIQLEAGVDTTYIPTAGAIVTRTADVLNYTISSVLTTTNGSIGGTFYLDTLSTGVYRRVLYLHDLTLNNRITIHIPPTGGLYLYVVVGGVNTVSLSPTTVPVLGFNKFLLTYENNSYILYLNGEVIGSDLSSGVPVVTTLSVGNSYIGTEQLNDQIKDVRYYNKPLTESQAIRMTS